MPRVRAAFVSDLPPTAAPAGTLPAAAPDPPPPPLDETGGLNLLAAALGASAMRFVLDGAGSGAGAGAGSGAGSGAANSPVTTRTDDNSDLALGGGAARAAYGVDGSGIKIGIMSDSFNLRGGYAADVANGDLPAGVRVLREGPAGGNDEGRAMADLIHAAAPGAQLLFHTATGGEADFAAGIQALTAAGCNVIVDDVAYLDEPFFQDGGILQQAVEQAVGQGVSYFTSASNEGRDFWESAFDPMRVTLPSLPGTWNAARFGGGAAALPYVDLTVPNNGSCAIDLQWDQPFATIGAGHGSANSLAMALYTSGGQLVGTAGGLAVGQNPEQLLQFTNTTGGTGFRLVVVSNGLGAVPDLFKFIAYGNATIDNAAAGQGSGTVTGHELVAGANTVGAIAYSATPAFGGNDATEGFSSVGSGTVLFDAQGNRLAAPIDAGKVSFVAPDGSMTSVFAPFYGTSAAAPNAAAVAALMLQANPDLTPGQVSAMLADSAVPAMGPAGGTGAGLIQASGAVALAMAALGHR